jgi:hypothetical protein
VLEVRESLFNAILHERVKGAESTTEVKVDGQFDGDCVQGLEGGCEMLGELAAACWYAAEFVEVACLAAALIRQRRRRRELTLGCCYVTTGGIGRTDGTTRSAGKGAVRIRSEASRTGGGGD